MIRSWLWRKACWMGWLKSEMVARAWRLRVWRVMLMEVGKTFFGLLRCSWEWFGESEGDQSRRKPGLAQLSSDLWFMYSISWLMSHDVFLCLLYSAPFQNHRSLYRDSSGPGERGTVYVVSRLGLWPSLVRTGPATRPGFTQTWLQPFHGWLTAQFDFWQKKNLALPYWVFTVFCQEQPFSLD